MNPLFSVARAGALARTDGTAALSGAKRADGASFFRSLEYVIRTDAVDRQRRDDSNRGQAGVIRGQQGATAGTQSSVPSGAPPEDRQVADQRAPQKRDNYGYDTPGGYRLDNVPSTLDPGSMAFLLGWMGGGAGSVRQQQQDYLEIYRQRYPNGVSGVSSYITLATNFLTGAR